MKEVTNRHPACTVALKTFYHKSNVRSIVRK
jgi:hypothetical protein